MPTYTETLEVTRDTSSDVALDISLHGASTFRVLADGTVTSPGATANTAALALKAPLASPTFTGTTTTASAEIGAGGSSVGFYGTTPIAKQTGVAVTAGGVHAALVALGLIAA